MDMNSRVSLFVDPHKRRCIRRRKIENTSAAFVATLVNMITLSRFVALLVKKRIWSRLRENSSICICGCICICISFVSIFVSPSSFSFVAALVKIKIKASEMLVAPRISECFDLPWSALVCYSLLTSSFAPFGRSGRYVCLHHPAPPFFSFFDSKHSEIRGATSISDAFIEI